MIYVLAISVAFSTMALVTLALSELARSLLSRARGKRRRTLGLALRLRSELTRELDRLHANHRSLQRRQSGSMESAQSPQQRLDRLADPQVRAIQSLRDRLARINEQLAEPEGHDVERLWQRLSELASEVELLAAETQGRRRNLLGAGRKRGMEAGRIGAHRKAA